MESLLSGRSLTVVAIGGAAVAGAVALFLLTREGGGKGGQHRRSRRRHGQGTAASSRPHQGESDEKAMGLQTLVPRKYYEIGHALEKTGLAGKFTTRQLEVLYDEFQRHTLQRTSTSHAFRVPDDSQSETRQLSKEEFARIFRNMGVTDDKVIDANFRVWDQDGSGTVDFAELLTALAIMTRGSRREKLEFLFKAYDLDGNGYITREELAEIYVAQAAANGKALAADQVDRAIAHLFNELKPVHPSGLSHSEFMRLADSSAFVLDGKLMERFGEEMAR